MPTNIKRVRDKQREKLDLAVALFLSFHEIHAQEDVEPHCKDPEKCFLKTIEVFEKALLSERQRVVGEIKTAIKGMVLYKWDKNGKPVFDETLLVRADLEELLDSLNKQKDE